MNDKLTIEEKCPKCAGTGKENAKKCVFCEGRGTVLTQTGKLLLNYIQTNIKLSEH